MGNIILIGDARERLRELPNNFAHTCVTSPPYFGLRDYGVEGQIGLEGTHEEFTQRLVEVFREVRRVLREDGTLWLNLGDSYGKPKQLSGIPWRVALALQSDGWYLRQDIIWHKPNSMPEPVRDRCTRSHEYIFLLSKSPNYYFDFGAMKEPAVQAGRVRADRIGGNKYVEGVKHSDGSVFTGSDTRNKRSVWTVTTKPYKGAHFATFPPDLIRPCVLAGAPKGGMVLDPFGGAGTTALVAKETGRESTLIELNPEYANLAAERTGAMIIPEGM